MNLEQRLADEARENRDRRFTAFAVAFFATVATFGTVTSALDGTLAWPVIGMNSVLLYGVHLAFQGWRHKETRFSCAAMLVLPGLFLGAHLMK
ncbi:hypothetical protein [Streptomyces sp. NPDC050264]|uniref:hypothetical protein n=1 Tax=Streptomyces sp. NPDC050264 TaxID=3155038 RepID=UPI003438B9A3